MAQIKVIGFADMCRKQPQLPGGAAAFALKPGSGKAGFGTADDGDGGATRLDLIRDAVEERGALVTRQGGIGRKRRLGGLAGGGDMGGGAHRVIARFSCGRG